MGVSVLPFFVLLSGVVEEEGEELEEEEEEEEAVWSLVCILLRVDFMKLCVCEYMMQGECVSV